MWISPAYAQAAGGGGGDMITTMLPLVLIFVVFYFLLIRPQQKKAKQHREMLGNLRRGDRIVTSGGLIGTVTRLVGDKELAVEVSEGVKVRILRGMVSDVLEQGKGRPRSDRDEDEGDEELDEEEEQAADDKRAKTG